MKINNIAISLIVALIMILVPGNMYASSSTETVEAPSDTYLRNEIRSEAASTKISAFSNSYMSISRSGSFAHWENLVEEGGGTDIGGGHNMGAPIGDTSLPMVISLLILYLVYRGISVKRRKSGL